MRGSLFCFGLGYSGMALARALLGDGWRVAGTCRQAHALEVDIAVAAFSGASPMAEVRALSKATHLLATVPPDSSGDPVLAHHASDIAACRGLRWAGYLSTTGVYGDTGGAWVDESAAPRPTSAEAKRRLAAEGAWLDLWAKQGVPVHLFRLAGIYGPGRNPFRRLREGAAVRIDKPGHAFSRIHLGDLVATLRASMDRPNPGAVYNVCDDLPAPSAEVIAHAATLFGCATPPLVPFAEADLSPRARAFYADDRRVSNRRIKEELGVRLRCPSYREGLAAILAEESAQAEA
jgi:nucleoside-diphosphate-sugar epimerase